MTSSSEWGKTVEERFQDAVECLIFSLYGVSTVNRLPACIHKGMGEKRLVVAGEFSLVDCGWFGLGHEATWFGGGENNLVVGSEKWWEDGRLVENVRNIGVDTV